MREKCLFKKIVLLDVNFLFWKKKLHLFRLTWSFQGHSLSKILVVRGKQKRAKECFVEIVLS